MQSQQKQIYIRYSSEFEFFVKLYEPIQSFHIVKFFVKAYNTKYFNKLSCQEFLCCNYENTLANLFKTSYIKVLSYKASLNKIKYLL